ncbi:MAG: hypothetical protein OXD45_04760 [Rhodobacteraceae bacterium]|nr:hypothetical protein [Paracoccaceae bacterium]
MKTKDQEPKVRKNRTKYYEEFETIKDTPQNVARAILTRPPKKDWRFLKNRKKG